MNGMNAQMPFVFGFVLFCLGFIPVDSENSFQHKTSRLHLAEFKDAGNASERIKAPACKA